MLKNMVLVALGGALGSVARYCLTLWISAKYFPIGTLIVNFLGCFIIGLLFALAIKDDSLSTNWKLFLATGVCGGFTTFSAFAMENIQLLQSGKVFTAMLYIVLSIVLGLFAAYLGYKITITANI